MHYYAIRKLNVEQGQVNQIITSAKHQAMHGLAVQCMDCASMNLFKLEFLKV